jgi:hypothetical protein
MLTEAIWADKKWVGLWQISLHTSSKTENLNKKGI